MPAPQTSIRPSAKPEGGPNRQIPTTLTESRRDVREFDTEPISINISQTTNPLTQLGQTQGSTFRVISERPLNILGAYFRTSNDVEGGPLPREGNSTTAQIARYFEETFPELDPLRHGEVGLTLDGLDDVTASHEFMHRGLQALRNLGFDTLKEELGSEVANIVMVEDHPLIQAFMESLGKKDNNYMENLSASEKQLIFRAVTPVSQLALKLILEAGFEPPPVKQETGEQEAQRKLQLKQINLIESKSFLQRLLGLFK